MLSFSSFLLLSDCHLQKSRFRCINDYLESRTKSCYLYLLVSAINWKHFLGFPLPVIVERYLPAGTFSRSEEKISISHRSKRSPPWMREKAREISPQRLDVAQLHDYFIFFFFLTIHLSAVFYSSAINSRNFCRVYDIKRAGLSDRKFRNNNRRAINHYRDVARRRALWR